VYTVCCNMYVNGTVYDCRVDIRKFITRLFSEMFLTVDKKNLFRLKTDIGEHS
jgi:hypothetical protein